MASSATVGSAVVRLSFDGKDVKAQLVGVGKEVEDTGKSTGSKWGSTWVVAAGNLIAKGVSKVSSMVTNTMGNAISRLDTLNNFPKVMTSLGYSAEAADLSISKIGDSLDGLPTSLDAMASDVQKLAATMGNLAGGEINATTVGLALNDMFLAGGKGAEAASAAMEQYNQMLASGKADMQSWRSMVNAAPGQMDQLAKSILGANANQSDLYNAMQKGTVTFDQFNAALVKLDSEGGANFESFHNQAVAATDGVATQIENIGNTLNKVVTSALEGNLSDISKYTAQLADRIGAVGPTLIQGFIGAFNTLMAALPGMVIELLPAIMQGINSLALGVFQAMPLFANAIVQATPIIINGLMELLWAILSAIPTIMPELINSITTMITTIAFQFTKPEFLALILTAAVQLFMSLAEALPQVIDALANALPLVISNIVAFLTDPGNIMMIISAAVQLFFGIVSAVPQILGALLGAFGSLVGNLWVGITNMFAGFASNFGTFITGIFKNAINGMLSYIENFINAPINLINGFLDVINNAFGWLGVNIGHIELVQLPRLAQGGIAYSATTAIIGEQGKEAVLPLEHNTDNWAGLLANTLLDEMEEERAFSAGGITQYNTIEINNEMDAQDIGRVLMESMRRAA